MDQLAAAERGSDRLGGGRCSFLLATEGGEILPSTGDGTLPDSKISIPGLKPPVRESAPCDDSDPPEADAFNRMIRELRNQSPVCARS
jgi:hypothetical protein